MIDQTQEPQNQIRLEGVNSMGTMDESLLEPPIPRWVGVMVAVTLVGSLVVGGGLWGWSYYSRPDPKNLVEVGVPSSMMQRSVFSAPRPPQFPPMPAGFVQSSASNYQAKSGDFLLMVSKTLIGRDWNLRILYTKPDLITPEQAQALKARQRLAMDPLFAKSLNVSDEQVAKLKATPLLLWTGISLAVSPSDSEKLKKMWTSFIANTPAKAADGPPLLAEIQAIGLASLPPTQKTIADTVVQIQEILTAEQIAAFK